MLKKLIKQIDNSNYVEIYEEITFMAVCIIADTPLEPKSKTCL